jgi:SAM-dependent methyltransferase
MINLLKTIYWFFRKAINSLGTSKKCYICKRTFHHFTEFRGGSKNLSDYINALRFVGSDIDNFGCMYCNSNDRERHLFMFFDKLDLWPKFKNSRIIHFAPEINLPRYIFAKSPTEYVMGDLSPNLEKGIVHLDVTKIPFNENSFDFLICNHVLEHVPDIKKALSEIYRVLKPNGLAVLQTPFSRLLVNNFEEDNIDSKELRNIFYGQEDHVRVFGQTQFLHDIEKQGLELQLKKHSDFFDATTTKYYGVNGDEDLILVSKGKK